MSTPFEKHVYLGLSEVSSAELTEKKAVKVLNFKATELRLGLPGSESPERVKVNDDDGNNNDGSNEFNGVNLLAKNMVSGAKRGFSVAIHGTSNKETTTLASSRVQLVGWPPVRSFRKNSMAINAPKTNDNQESKAEIECRYVKVSMDGAPYLRKIDLKTFGSYVGLSSALETMFSGFTMGQYGNKGHPCADERSESRLIDSLQRSEYVLTYEDKDGDWMLVGDVPWNMFIDTCRRLRIMKSSEAVGLKKSAHLKPREPRLVLAELIYPSRFLPPRPIFCTMNLSQDKEVKQTATPASRVSDG